MDLSIGRLRSTLAYTVVVTGLWGLVAVVWTMVLVGTATSNALV